MEKEPNTENVIYMDEYPHIEERLRLKRMGQLTLFANSEGGQLLLFPEQQDSPDGAA